MKILKTALISSSTKAKMNWQDNIRTLLALLFLVFISWSFSSSGATKNQNKIVKKSGLTASVNQSQANPHAGEIKTGDIFDNIQLQAEAAYVFDVATQQVLFDLNSDASLPLASLTKIMTAIVAAENIPPNSTVTITKEAIMQEGDEGFINGEKWSASDLESAMLISSSNDAAFALASSFNDASDQNFVSLMNDKAKRLNLFQTAFLNPTGLDVSGEKASAYGSAKDVAKLLLYAIKNHSAIMETTDKSQIAINDRLFKNTNKLVDNLTGLIAGKTGFSDLAGGNLAIAAEKGYSHPIIIVVLGSTSDGRFNDVKTLYSLAIRN